MVSLKSIDVILAAKFVKFHPKISAHAILVAEFPQIELILPVVVSLAVVRRVPPILADLYVVYIILVCKIFEQKQKLYYY